MHRLLLTFLLAALAYSQEIRVDPRMELFSVIGLLADYDLMTRTASPYRAAMLNRFQSFRNHPAVRRFADARQRGFSFDGPVAAMACLSNPPELLLQASPVDCASTRIGGAAILRAWIDELRDFSRVSNFPAFFDENREFYAQLVQQVQSSMEGDVPAEMERYFRRTQASYAVMLNPLLTGNYGLRVPAAEGQFHTMISISPSTVANGVPQFATGAGLRMLLWHEFGHSFVNPVIDANEFMLRQSERLFEPIRDRMTAMAYGLWRVTVIEHVVRACVARMAAANIGLSRAAKEILAQRGLGFVYVGDLASRLEEFEAQDLPFEFFAERLIAALNELTARTLPATYYALPYAGTINSALADRTRFVYIVPASEPAIRAYVEGLRNRFAPAAPVLDDIEALTRDLSESSVVAYGTIDGNQWLARYRDAIPVTTAGYEANNLRLIASFPNPANPDLGVVAYTAAQPSDVVGINSVFHGPTAYVIADGTTILKAGDYSFENGLWTPE